MTTISKIKLLISLVAISVVFFGNDAIAQAYRCYDETSALNSRAKIHEQDSAEIKKLKTQYSELKKKLDDICKEIDDYDWHLGWTSQKEFEADAKKIGKYDEWINLKRELFSLQGQIAEIPLSANACGPHYPNGCPTGQKCWATKATSSGTMTAGNAGTTVSHNCECSAENPGSRLLGVTAKEVPSCDDVSYVHAGIGSTHGAKTHADGTTESFSAGIGAGGSLIGYEMQKTDVMGQVLDEIDTISNTEFCKIDQLKKDYTSNCYSCLIVANLIRTFMNAIDSTYNVTQVAGIKLLSIGMILWLAFFVINKLSSFVSIEPMDMLQELFTFFFKCLIAYTLITSGLKTLTTLIINPILIVGADYGIAVADTVLPEGMKGISEHNDKNSYKLTNSSVMDTEVFDKIMTLSKKADAAVSTNFVIGEALICHSIHAGAIKLGKKVSDKIEINFYFPDIWIWLCGAIIWFFAFMVVMGVNFYLLDLSFKIGFAILAMPVMIGLWPFNKFKNKFKGCVDILINAAGTFMFLGITTGLSVLIISAALGGTEELFAAIARDDKGYVSQRFSLGGGSFIIILFAFLYAHKLISKTEGLTDKFFESDMSGLNSMHHMTTQMIDFAKKQVGATLSLAGALVTGGASAAVKSAGRQAARTAIRKVRDIGKNKNK